MVKEYNINDIICNNRHFNFSLYHTYKDLLLKDEQYDPVIHIDRHNENAGAAEWLQACRDCNKFKIKCEILEDVEIMV